VNQSMELEERYCAHTYHPLPVVLTRGERVWVWDDQGNKYLDFLSAYSTASHGHCHPRLVRALQRQAEKLTIGSRAFYSELLGKFLEKICVLSGLDMAIPMNTGAEAVETAIKAARLWGHQVKKREAPEILVAEGNFHGRTTTVISFSSEPEYRRGFGPFMPGFRIIPFGDVEALERAIGPDTCAFLVEPIQGEAGVRIPPVGYLKAVAEVCRKRRILLLLDEVQSGLGRAGKMFAFQHEGIVPDGLILGKALGGGMVPVSAFVGKREILELFQPGSHGSTFGGNPLACAVGLEALAVLQEEGLIERSEELGKYLVERLRKMRYPWIKEVRGKGLWVGIEVDPLQASGREICERLMKRGILAKETHQTIVRLAPPLVITRQELDWALGEMENL